jgi:UPF0716 family protein affecting phage T7 exclusion
MDQRGEGFGLRLSGQKSDASAGAYAKRGCNLLVVSKLNTPAVEECSQTVDVLTGVARDFVHDWQVYPIGLRNIEDVSISESQLNPLVLLGDLLLRFGVLLAANADDGGKDASNCSIKSLMLVAMSSCLLVGFLLSMVATLLLVAVVFMMFAPWLWLLHVRVETRHVHAERHLAKAGVANGKVFERSFLGDRAQRGGAKTRRANGLAERGGQSPIGRLGFFMRAR